MKKLAFLFFSSFIVNIPVYGIMFTSLVRVAAFSTIKKSSIHVISPLRISQNFLQKHTVHFVKIFPRIPAIKSFYQKAKGAHGFPKMLFSTIPFVTASSLMKDAYNNPANKMDKQQCTNNSFLQMQLHENDVIKKALHYIGIEVRDGEADTAYQDLWRNLTEQQQYAAFDFLITMALSKNVPCTLATLYAAMRGLPMPLNEYTDFISIIGAHCGECQRQALAKNLMLCKKIPPQLKKVLDTMGYYAIAKAFVTKIPPEEISGLVAKMPCSDPKAWRPS